MRETATVVSHLSSNVVQRLLRRCSDVQHALHHTGLFQATADHQQHSRHAPHLHSSSSTPSTSRCSSAFRQESTILTRICLSQSCCPYGTGQLAPVIRRSGPDARERQCLSHVGRTHCTMGIAHTSVLPVSCIISPQCISLTHCTFTLLLSLDSLPGRCVMPRVPCLTAFRQEQGRGQALPEVKDGAAEGGNMLRI